MYLYWFIPYNFYFHVFITVSTLYLDGNTAKRKYENGIFPLHVLFSASFFFVSLSFLQFPSFLLTELFSEKVQWNVWNWWQVGMGWKGNEYHSIAILCFHPSADRQISEGLNFSIRYTVLLLNCKNNYNWLFVGVWENWENRALLV